MQGFVKFKRNRRGIMFTVVMLSQKRAACSGSATGVLEPETRSSAKAQAAPKQFCSGAEGAELRAFT
jgi:hypothetical protein